MAYTRSFKLFITVVVTLGIFTVGGYELDASYLQKYEFVVDWAEGVKQTDITKALHPLKVYGTKRISRKRNVYLIIVETDLSGDSVLAQIQQLPGVQRVEFNIKYKAE